MNNCVLELQAAILEKLKNDGTLIAALGGAKIYDHVPTRVSFPYVAFGEINSKDWSTSSDEGVEFHFDLHLWSRRRGRSEIYALEARIKYLLDDQDLNLTTQSLINLRWELSQVERDEDARCYLGICRFRAVVEMQ